MFGGVPKRPWRPLNFRRSLRMLLMILWQLEQETTRALMSTSAPYAPLPPSKGRLSVGIWDLFMLKVWVSIVRSAVAATRTRPNFADIWLEIDASQQLQCSNILSILLTICPFLKKCKKHFTKNNKSELLKIKSKLFQVSSPMMRRMATVKRMMLT